MRIKSISVILVVTIFAGCASQSEGLIAADSNSAKQLVLVAGATGKTGKEVVKHLLTQDYPVRVLVRNKEKAEKMFGDSVEIRVADVTDAAAVMSATRGVSDVISAIGSATPAGPNSPEFVDYGGAKHLIEASVAADVDQFVMVSSLGATHADHPLNKMFGNVMVWKLKAENVLRSSGLSYTVVRPGGLSDDAGRQSALFFDQGDKMESGRISRDDVAEICVAALSTQSARGETFEVITKEGEATRVWSDLFGQLSGK